jgi:uncharacterized RDD family membrane protein YckC
VHPSAPLDTEVAIETPEHIVFRHRLAGPSRRLLAYLVDMFVCYGAFFAVAVVVFVGALGTEALSRAAQDAETTTGVGIGLLLILLFAIKWVYFTVLEARWGTTPGKRLLGCRVVTLTGRPPGFAAAALRNVLRAADALPLSYGTGVLSVAGLVSMSATRTFQRLGDLVAGTLVVVPERPRPAVPIVLSPPADPREIEALRHEVRLEPDERQAIEMFLRRRGKLGSARERELATLLAPFLEEQVGGPVADPSRTVALLFERATHAGREEAPPSSRSHGSGRAWR